MANQPSKRINVVARLILAASLIVWTGANFCVNVMNFKAIMNAGDKGVSIILAIGSVVIPLAIAVWLFRSVSKLVPREESRKRGPS